MILFKYFRMMIFSFLTFSPISLFAMENDSVAKECALCCENQNKKMIECLHCKQEFCRTCAERWIGVLFSFTTNFRSDASIEDNFQARNNSCPFCKQQLTREELDRMILEADPGAILRTETQLLIEKIDRKESLTVQIGTIRSCNIPVVLIDDVKFAVITDELKGSGNISLDFSDYNLIVLSDIIAENDILIKCKNAFFLGDINGDNIDFSIRELLVWFGNIQSRKDMLVPPESRRISGGSYRDQRLAFIKEFKDALREGNINALKTLGNLIKALLLYKG